MRNFELKTVKVSQKGQIVIPTSIQKELKIKKGDELLLVKKGRKIMLEKPQRLAKSVEDDFKDLLVLSEHTAKKLWDNKEDEIWNEYLKDKK